MILDIPYTKVLVENAYIKEPGDKHFTEAYAFAVTLILNRPLLWTVHTEDGAVYSRLPTWALRSFDSSRTLLPQELEPWGVLGTKAQVIKHAYLKDYQAEIPKLNISGRYLFTIDYLEGAFSEDPEQHKTANILELENGQIGSYPNNWLLFKDLHFTKDGEDRYKRTTSYWRANG